MITFEELVVFSAPTKILIVDASLFASESVRKMPNTRINYMLDDLLSIISLINFATTEEL